VSKNIQLLHDTWLCRKPDSTCPSSHCYVTPTGKHLHLSHEHFTCWAAAILKGFEHVTLSTPPNYWLFDVVNQDGNIAKEKLSPVLQHRLKDLETQVNEYHACPCCSTAPPAPSQCMNRTDVASDVLLPATHAPGDEISISDFCTHYDLTSTVLKKLQENLLRKACSLHFVSLQDLKYMQFNHGDITDL
ncbi:hypothetical protein PAXRUDRAFT_40605, partial [Paxillus rubicundulus Ve08.2h10]